MDGGKSGKGIKFRMRAENKVGTKMESKGESGMVIDVGMRAKGIKA